MMTAVTFARVAMLPGQGNVFLTGVTDMCFGEGPNGPVLYVNSGPGGGVAAYELRGSTLVLIDQYSLPAQSSTGIDSTFLQMDMGGDPTALITGVAGTGLYGIALDAAGEMVAQASLGLTLPADLLACLNVSLGGTTYVYGLRLGSDAISVWKVAGNGDLVAVSTPAPNGSVSAGPRLTDLASVVRGGTTYLVAASDSGEALISYRIGTNGVPVEVDRVSAAEGLGIASPSAIVAVQVDGRAYAVMAAADTGTLTVAEVMSDGTLAVTDHVMDDLDTRFQGVSVLETITIGGRAYVVAAGTDDGITLLQVLPGGRLLDMGSLADSTNTTLNNVAAVALTEVNGDLQIMVASGNEAGVSWISVDLGAAGLTLRGTSAAETLTGGTADDILTGLAGNDRLNGGSGQDIMMDGTGTDVMTGVAGNDTFVLTADGVADTITDFDSRYDRIDLSGWAMLRSTGQLTITTTADGAEIRYGSEVLQINTYNGASLQPGTIIGLDLLNLSRLDPAWIPTVVPPQTLYGGTGSDTLLSSNGNDLLHGNAGNDVLDGGYGNDRLYGGDGNDRINGQHDNDTLYGDGGNDTLRGEAGNDLIYAGTGNDSLWAGDGTDTLWTGDGDDAAYGEAGNDTGYGEAGVDTLYGGDGNDRLYGGAGSDRIYGDGGNDSTYGEAGNDRLYGGAGNDLVDGGTEIDTLYGADGDDLLRGGSGTDSIWGEVGNDSLYGDADNDSLYGGDGSDQVYGGAGTDLIYGGTGNDIGWGGDGNDGIGGDDGDDTLIGEAGNDNLYGDTGADALYGGDGSDTLKGMGGNDRLAGDAGADIVYGGDGSDTLYGHAGTDKLYGDSGSDTLYGGENNDTLTAGDGTDKLYGDAGIDRLYGEGGADKLYGGSGDDTLKSQGGNDLSYGDAGHDVSYGGDGIDTLYGGDGNDRLYGDGGNDWLYGGNGNDRLDGGASSDRLQGGAGADMFVFVSGDDRVLDFVNNTDTLLLDNALWGGKTLSTDQILDFARVSNGSVIFEFAGGHSLVIEGLTNPDLLRDDIGVI